MRIYKAEQYIPYYVCSIAAHFANLRNVKYNYGSVAYKAVPSVGFRKQSKPFTFYKRLGRVCQTRLHILFVSPMGFSKTLFMEQFLNKEWGFFPRTVPVYMGNKLTEAGLVGSGVLSQKGKFSERPGLAKEMPDGVLGFEEVSSIVSERQGESEQEVDRRNSILMILDSGRAVKRLASVTIDYMAYPTLWGGTQPGRALIDVASGMSRRFLILRWFPNDTDSTILKRAYDEGEGREPNRIALNEIHDMIMEIQKEFLVKTMRFTPKYKRYRNSLDITHYEMDTMDRLAIGYSIATRYKPGSEFLTVDINPELRQLMAFAVECKNDVLLGASKQQLISLMKGVEYYMRNGWPLNKLKREGIKKGLSEEQITRIVGTMCQQGEMERVFPKRGDRKRKTKVFLRD